MDIQIKTDYFTEGSQAMQDLEHMLNRAGINGVLCALANICYLKADHLEGNWQDHIAAKVWIKRGRRLDDVATSILMSDE
jgi:hypothetical protein